MYRFLFLHMTIFYLNILKYKNENNKVLCEIAPEFELLEHNAIMDTFRQLYREEIGVALK